MVFEGLTEEQKQQFWENGILAVGDFLTEDEVESLKNSCLEIVRAMDPKVHRGIFSTTEHNQAKDRYFLDSGDKVRFFFEKNSFDDDGQLKMEKEECLNKIGHCMHWHLPAFKKVTFSEKTRKVAIDLGLEDPAVIQGMYIFKQPKIGTEVTPHQDGTFLRNEPLKLFGFWFPIDDATVENGCLWFAPGSHKLPISRHFERNQEAFDETLRDIQDESKPLMIFNGQDPVIPDDQWVAAPVKKGSLVIIHGQVMHKSADNTSDKPRHAYTFHMVETKGSEYAKENWLQQTEEMPFPKLFQN